MKGKKRYNKRGKRRYNRNRKFSKRKFKATFSKMPPEIVPDRALVKLKWADYFNLVDLAANTSEEVVFSGNNPADPAQSLSTVKVTGYSKWQAFYKYCKVYGSKCKISVVGDTNNIYPLTIGIVPAITSSVYTNLPTFQTQPYAKTRQFTTTGESGHLKSYMSTEKLYGLKRNTVDFSPSFWFNSDITTGAAFLWNWHVIIYNQSESATPVDAEYMVEIEYYCEFLGRRELALS